MHTARIYATDETPKHTVRVTCEDGADLAVAPVRGGHVAPAGDDAEAPYAPTEGPLFVNCEKHGTYLLLFQALRRSASGEGVLMPVFLPFPGVEWGHPTVVTFPG